tara:strand:- start:3467 stop:3802 length:336 start_codon:yes stop_codon:yes gene_type:complete
MPKKKSKSKVQEEVVEHIEETIEEVVETISEDIEEFNLIDDFSIEDKYGEETHEDLVSFCNSNGPPELAWDFCYQLMARGAEPQTARNKWRKVRATLKKDPVLKELVESEE